MKVLGIPSKNINMGSTRTRFYYMLKNLPAGWTWERYRPGAEGDILYIQKIQTPEVWRAVDEAKRRGMPIVYERDDFNKPWNPDHTKVMNLSDAVTTITKGILDKVKHRTTTPMYLVPDGFDYDIQREERVPVRPKLRKAVTYGRQANIHAVAPFYAPLKLKKAYICDRVIKELKGAKYTEWKLKKFKKKVSKYDLILIVHAEGHRKKYKDIGRAMVGMALGIPVVCTPSIEAERIYKEVGYPWLVVKNAKAFRKVVKRLKPQELRQKISDAFYEYAWANWRPDQSSKLMADIFEKVIKEKKHGNG